MVSVIEHGDDDIIVFPKTYHVVYNLPVEEGHITGNDETVRSRGIKKSCIDPYECTARRDEIYYYFEVKVGIGYRFVGNQDNVLEDFMEQFYSPIDDPSSFHPYKGFVFPHPDVFSASENYPR